jgi:hypothetical protein
MPQKIIQPLDAVNWRVMPSNCLGLGHCRSITIRKSAESLIDAQVFLFRERLLALLATLSGEPLGRSSDLWIQFNPKVSLEFRGTTITSDGGLPSVQSWMMPWALPT